VSKGRAQGIAGGVPGGETQQPRPGQPCGLQRRHKGLLRAVGEGGVADGYPAPLREFGNLLCKLLQALTPLGVLATVNERGGEVPRRRRDRQNHVRLVLIVYQLHPGRRSLQAQILDERPILVRSHLRLRRLQIQHRHLRGLFHVLVNKAGEEKSADLISAGVQGGALGQLVLSQTRLERLLLEEMEALAVGVVLPQDQKVQVPRRHLIQRGQAELVIPLPHAGVGLQQPLGQVPRDLP